MIQPILQVRQLSKSFGGLAAVDDVSLDVKVGELHAVIGPNGAGKTTLINVLSGDLSPSAGSVLFRGIEMAHLAPDTNAWKARFPIVYQSTSYRVFEVSSASFDQQIRERMREAQRNPWKQGRTPDRERSKPGGSH